MGELGPGNVLDVGCGTGTLLIMARARGLRCFGIDTSGGMLIEAKQSLPAAELVQASYYQIPFPDGSFDQVVETNALSGLLIKVDRALSEMLRVCRVGGAVLLADYALPPQMGWTHRMIQRVGALVGDYPQDYVGLFGKLGYEAEVDILGGHGMYQLIRVRKGPGVIRVE